MIPRLIFAAILAALYASSSDAASPLRICEPGDFQASTHCTNDATAWTHGKAAVDWIVANPDICDVTIFPGDLVNGAAWSDCWCAAQADPSPSDCTIYSASHPLGFQCDAAECVDPDTDPHACCNSPTAQGCVDGIPGYYCEWERLRALVDELEAAGEPWIVIPGNHDLDVPYSTIFKCNYQATIFNQYFGAGKTSAHFASVGSLQQTFPCPSLPSGESEQPDQFWYVLDAAGTDWLFIGIGWIQLRYDNPLIHYYGMTDATFAWVRQAIDDHLGMPTFLLTHAGVVTSCSDAGMGATHEDAWCQSSEFLGFQNWWTATSIYDEFLQDPVRSRQLLAVLSGHIRKTAYTLTAETPYPTAGIAVDFTNPIPGAPGWQTYANGGGGVVQIIKVDPLKGEISTKAYSPEENAWVGIFGDEPSSHYEIRFPMCSSGRFDFSEEACPELEPLPSFFGK